MRNYSAICVIPRRIRDRFEFLTIDAVRFDGPNANLRLTKFPGGMEEKSDGGNPERTLREEVEEEIGLIIKPHAHLRQLSTISERRGHLKFVYLVWRSACRGRIRTWEVDDKRSRLYIPKWLTFGGLEEKICDTHRPILSDLKEIGLGR